MELFRISKTALKSKSQAQQPKSNMKVFDILDNAPNAMQLANAASPSLRVSTEKMRFSSSVLHVFFIDMLNEIYPDFNFSSLKLGTFEHVPLNTVMNELQSNILSHINSQTFNEKFTNALKASFLSDKVHAFLWRGGIVQLAADDESIAEDISMNANNASRHLVSQNNVPVHSSASVSAPLGLESEPSVREKIDIITEVAAERCFESAAQRGRRTVMAGDEVDDSDDDEDFGENDNEMRLDAHPNVDDITSRDEVRTLTKSTVGIPPIVEEFDIANSASASRGLLWSSDFFFFDPVTGFALYFGCAVRDHTKIQMEALQNLKRKISPENHHLHSHHVCRGLEASPVESVTHLLDADSSSRSRAVEDVPVACCKGKDAVSRHVSLDSLSTATASLMIPPGSSSLSVLSSSSTSANASSSSLSRKCTPQSPSCPPLPRTLSNTPLLTAYSTANHLLDSNHSICSTSSLQSRAPKSLPSPHQSSSIPLLPPSSCCRAQLPHRSSCACVPRTTTTTTKSMLPGGVGLFFYYNAAVIRDYSDRPSMLLDHSPNGMVALSASVGQQQHASHGTITTNNPILRSPSLSPTLFKPSHNPFSSTSSPTHNIHDHNNVNKMQSVNHSNPHQPALGSPSAKVLRHTSPLIGASPRIGSVSTIPSINPQKKTSPFCNNTPHTAQFCTTNSSSTIAHLLVTPSLQIASSPCMRLSTALKQLLDEEDRSQGGPLDLGRSASASLSSAFAQASSLRHDPKTTTAGRPSLLNSLTGENKRTSKDFFRSRSLLNQITNHAPRLSSSLLVNSDNPIQANKMRSKQVNPDLLVGDDDVEQSPHKRKTSLETAPEKKKQKTAGDDVNQ
eukprot:GDKJ01037455.1.p1 GENE.GDKJ01037455.1~~GDKJ01037455.1.p1  ORF type:complete len:883 (+),score=203.77 GDKJ01037455.1:106-2649(+)